MATARLDTNKFDWFDKYDNHIVTQVTFKSYFGYDFFSVKV
jgi:hypothetical protein